MRKLLLADSVRDAGQVLGNALLIEDDRIVAVGDADTLLSRDVAEIDYSGGVVVPGLCDAHFHPIGYAAVLTRPSLKSAANFTELAEIVRDALDGIPAGRPLTGLRLDDETLAEGRLPTRDDLDAVAPDHPVLLIRYCGHVASANSAALHAAGVDPSTPDPPGGAFDRNGHGRPTGVVRETAVGVVARAVDALAPPLPAEDVAAAMTAAAALGLTAGGAIVARGASMWGAGGDELEILCSAAGDLPFDLAVFVAAADPADLQRSADRIRAAGGKLRFGGVKMFSDGSLGGHTAAMHDAFSDAPDRLGTDRFDPAWAFSMARAALDLDGRVAIHAIGDAANSGVLDLMEQLVDDGADVTRLRVEHASVLTAGDIDRFGRLGVTAVVQPAFLASEYKWLERRVGPERIGRTYAFRSLLEAGAPLAGSSDSPVEPLDPLAGMAAARDRCSVVPAQGLEPGDTLRLFSSWAARAIGSSASLEPGAYANLTILDRDPVAASPGELRSARVRATWIGGEPVAVPGGIRTWND